MSPLSFFISKFKALRHCEKNTIHRMVLAEAFLGKVRLSHDPDFRVKTSLRVILATPDSRPFNNHSNNLLQF